MTSETRAPRGSGAASRLGLVLVALALPAAACQSTPAPVPPVAVAPPPATAAPADSAAAAPAAAEDPAVLANRQRHHAFTEKILTLEKEQVNDFWHCLFGEEGSGFRFDSQEALKAALGAQLETEPKAFLARAGSECVAAAQKAAAAVKQLTAPAEYQETLQRYEKSCTALAAGLTQWTAGATRGLALREQQQRVLAAGDKWSAASGTGPLDPQAFHYHQFLHCAVPDLDKLADGQALADLLTSRCPAGAGAGPEPGFLGRLRDTCLPAAPAPPAKATAAYKHTLTRFVAQRDRLKAGWDGCFRRLNQEQLGSDFAPLGQAWADWLAASTRMYELIKKAFCDGGEKKFCEPAR